MTTVRPIVAIVEQVRPVVLPLFPTGSPRVGTPSMLEGGAAAMLVEPAGPRSRILPLRSTWLGTISAIAASTLLGECPQRAAFEVPHLPGSLATGFSAAPLVKWATVSGGGAVAAVHASCNG